MNDNYLIIKIIYHNFMYFKIFNNNHFGNLINKPELERIILFYISKSTVKSKLQCII